MNSAEKDPRKDGESLMDLFELVPIKELDTTEIEGGLTWRQTIVLALTSGYLQNPSMGSASGDDPDRLKIRQSVDESFNTRFSESGSLEPFKDTVTFGLEVAATGYRELSLTHSEWSNDLELIIELLTKWQNPDETYITEDLARHVMYFMYPH